MGIDSSDIENATANNSSAQLGRATILPSEKRRERVEIPAAARMISRREDDHANYKRWREAERCDVSRPNGHAERQDDRRAPLRAPLGCQIERRAGDEETYPEVKRRAMALLDPGFPGRQNSRQRRRSATRHLPLPRKTADQKSVPACDLHTAPLIEYNISR
jgi:hypothetical protein